MAVRKQSASKRKPRARQDKLQALHMRYMRMLQARADEYREKMEKLGVMRNYLAAIEYRARADECVALYYTLRDWNYEIKKRKRK